MIYLRKLLYADVKRIASLLNNRNISMQLQDSVPYPYLESDAVNFLNLLDFDRAQKVFGVEYERDLVGLVGLILQRGDYRLSAEIGYWLGEEYWGKGIMTEAVGEVVRLGFDKLNLLRIYSSVKGNNIASQRVMEKVGFSLEGVLRSAIIKNGHIQDEYRYAILNEHFEL